MKFIHPDMTAVARITADDAEAQIPIHAVVDDCLANKWLANVCVRYPDIAMLSEQADLFRYDLGGCVHMKEPVMRMELADGFKFSVIYTISDFLENDLRRIQTHYQWLGPHVYLRGKYTKAILTVETAKKITQWLDENEASAKKASHDFWETISIGSNASESS